MTRRILVIDDDRNLYKFLYDDLTARGAFTDVRYEWEGLLVEACGEPPFYDEITEIPLELQPPEAAPDI